MTGYRALTSLLASDYHRLHDVFTWGRFLKLLLLTDNYPVVFWYRVCRFASQKVGRKPLFWFSYWQLRRNQRRSGIRLSHHVDIGEGLNIVHGGVTYINSGVKIGRNCQMMHNVTIGVARAGDKGVPVIGDNVFIGPNAVLIGGIRIGDNVTIGANCVVNRDFPDGALVVGVPGVNKRELPGTSRA